VAIIPKRLAPSGHPPVRLAITARTQSARKRPDGPGKGGRPRARPATYQNLIHPDKDQNPTAQPDARRPSRQTPNPHRTKLPTASSSPKPLCPDPLYPDPL
jgi:hypothetical protein